MEPGKNPARPDLIAVSQACGLEINRRVYRRLGEMGWHVQIVADATFPGTTKPTEPQAVWERGLHRLERRGSRTRYHTYRGLNELLGRLRPRAVLLDLEPDSFLAWQLGRWCRKNGAPLIIQSCENLSAHFWKSLLGLRLKTAVRAGTMRAVNFLTRPLIAHVLGIRAGVVEQMVRQWPASITPLSRRCLRWRRHRPSRPRVENGSATRANLCAPTRPATWTGSTVAETVKAILS